MARLCYTTPMPHLRRCCSSSTSPPSRHWDPRPAFAAATERVRAGTLSPEDAHHLFDELLLQANPVPERSFNDFLAALARALSSAALRDGHSLALGIFNRVCREEAGPCVTPPTVCTYNILMDSCCRACHPNLGPAFFGRFLRTGLKADQIVAINLLKCLCHAKRKDEAVNMLLHRMSEFGCVPDAISYSIVLKSLCDDSRSQQALDLLQMVRKGGACSLDVVAYSTVIRSFFKEGEVRAMDKAKLVLQQMVDNGVRPNMYTCMELIHEQRVSPNVFTYAIVTAALCRMGRLSDAMDKLNEMIAMGLQPNKVVYHSLIQGFCTHGDLVKAKALVSEMMNKGIPRPNIVFFSSVINSLCKEGRVTEAHDIFDLAINIGERPNVITFSSLIDGYCLAGKMDKAFGVLDANTFEYFKENMCKRISRWK
ncbi:unnamed protein product [Triticum turgidum subsp. durum]|uniref:Pentatricopeptide repeat-containing protein n=1 Tax=Triticum turgidum subsp. durum TaxID=4567 RepID=A0A9R0Q0P7_TRITD|nr:unnamed protein product [Triticum turgidum subsp. durum]